MIKNKFQFVALLRSQYGYAGDNSDAAIKAFCLEIGADIKDKEGKSVSIDDILSKKVVIEYNATDGEDVEVKKADDNESPQDNGGSGESLNEATATTATRSISEQVRKSGQVNKAIYAPKIHSNGEAKRYNINANLGKTVFSDAERATGFGAWARGRLAKFYNIEYSQRSSDMDIVKAITGSNQYGSPFVPPEYSADLIDNLEKHGGVWRTVSKTSMSGDTLSVPKVSAAMSGYWVGQGAAITASQPGAHNVELTCKKAAALCEVSNEFLEDSPLNAGEYFAKQSTAALNYLFDGAYFVGDGTSNYGHFVGCTSALGSAGIVDSGQSALTSVTQAKVDEWMGTLAGRFQASTNKKIVCNGVTYERVFRRLARAAGGTTMTEVVDGVRRNYYDGIEVIIVEIMPTSDGSIVALYGDFDAATKLGVRRDGIQIASSPDRGFVEDTTYYRAIKRVAVAAHDLGDSNVAGALVGLKL